MRNTRTILAVGLLLTPLLAGCRDDGETSSSTSSGEPGSTSSSSSSATTGAGGEGGAGQGGAGQGGATGGGGSAPICQSAKDCDDADPCTDDVCNAGFCANGSVVIDDKDGCTTDACDAKTGAISHTPVVTDDTDACTKDACDVGTGVVSHTPLNLDDANGCTIDACDAQTGTITHVAVVIDDNVACTLDACNTGTGIVSHMPLDASCGVNEHCDPMLACQLNKLSSVVVSELVALGSAGNTGELIEIFNPTNITGSIGGFAIKNDLGQAASIRAPSDPMGTNQTPVFIAPGAYAYGVPNPANAADIPAGAAFVYGDPGTSWEIADAGDVITVLSGAAVLDVVDFKTPLVGNIAAFNTDASTPVLPGQFPGYSGASTQLDPTFLTPAGNDSGDHWCVTFRAASTPGAANGSCSAFVINEVLYDFAHPTLSVADDMQVFVELAGPGGGGLGGVHVLGIDGDGMGNQEPNVTLPVGTRMPVDGLFVIADGNGGATLVPNADFVTNTGDPQNGGGVGDAIELLLPGNPQVLIDTVGYGLSTVIEGTPLISITPDKVALSSARDALSTDTNNNAADFHFDPTPTPGSPNLPVAPSILSMSVSDGLASAPTTITLVVKDFADLRSENTVPPADNDVNATFAGTVTADAAAFTDGCSFVDIADAGRGAATITCAAPAHAGVVVQGDFVLQNPAALGGGSVTLPNGWTYTGVLNETNMAEETDYCVLQFPPTLSVVGGQMTENVYGQLYEAGVTETDGPPAGVLAQLGYGALGVNPTTQSGWIFKDASYNKQDGNNDEFQASIMAPVVSAVTHFRYTYRFSFDGGLTFTYCDIDGAGSNPGLTFAAAQLGDMMVSP